MPVPMICLWCTCRPAIAELGWANARHLARSLGEGILPLAALSEPNEEAQPDPEPELSAP